MGRGGIIFAVVFLFIISIFAISITDEVPDDFDHYRTDVNIIVGDDGSAEITETYSFRWSGISSGEMYISFTDGKANALRGSSVSCDIDGTAASFVSSYNAGVSATHTGVGLPLYTYGRNSLSGDWEMNAFYKRASSGEHTVTFRYTLDDVAVRYADCVEFYYKVFTSFSDSLSDLTVTVTMPPGSLQSETYIFGHGDPNGYCEFPGSTADPVFKSSRLDSYTMFEIRVISKQTDLYPGIPVTPGKTFDSIMAEEKRFQDETDRAIRLANVQLFLIGVMFFAGILLFLIRVKFVKRNKPMFKQPYTREIPSVKPNITARLAGHYKFTSASYGNRISATILNLAVMKAIAIEEGPNKEIVFVPLEHKLQLTGFERSVHKMLFVGMTAGDEKITLSAVKSVLMSYPAEQLQIYETDEREFNSKAYIDEELTERNRMWDKIPLVPCLLMVPVIAIAIFIDFSDYIPIGMFVVFINFGLMIFGSIRTPPALTVGGEDEYARTMALKRFYTDMTLMKERQTLEIALWEKHLVYATALGVADKVIKELSVRLTQLNLNMSPGFAYIHVLHNAGLAESISSMGRMPYAAFIRAAAGNFSGGGGGSGGYSGGGGGGFSGGGGGGFGGGGGGHR